MALHSEKEVKRCLPTQKRPTSGRRKALRAKNRFRKGIDWCVCTRDPWVTDNIQYTANREDPNCETPWLVNSISTDGLQVKICLATLAKTRPLLNGVKEFVKKGFTGLSTSVPGSPELQKVSVCKMACKLTKVKKCALSRKNRIYATVRANVACPGEKLDSSIARFSAKAKI